MPEPNPDKIKPFLSSSDLYEWLRTNHGSETELWVKIYKKSTGAQSIEWQDLVIECLCWGWIDGIKKSYDEVSYLQRISPRRAGSVWSKINCDHVERLIAEGRMQRAGLVHVEAAKADGRWDRAYNIRSAEVPADFLDALEKLPGAKKKFETLTKAEKVSIIYNLQTAKKPETRQRRFDTFLAQLAEGGS